MRFVLSTSAGAALLALVWCAQARAGDDGVYKWVEKDGTVHYSDMPPPKVSATKLKNTAARAATAGGEPEAAQRAAPTYVEQDIEFRKRRSAADEAAKKAQETKQKADAQRQACSDSRGRLATLQQGGRIYRSNEKGERVYFDDKTFAQEIAKEKKFLDQNCKA